MAAATAAVLASAHVVATTLSSSLCRDMLDADLSFTAVVVDEAAQATEPSAVLPLRFRAELMVLVGDDQQLPATVVSRLAASLGYRRSLLQRLREAGSPVRMLTTQYRMHPDICAFPNRHFYRGALEVRPPPPPPPPPPCWCTADCGCRWRTRCWYSLA